MTQLLQRYFGGGTLASLQDHATRLRRLQGAFERCLPPPLAASCKVANLKDGVLVVFAQGNAAAVKLKQMGPSLVQHLAEQGHALREMRVRIVLHEAAPWRPATAARSIPEAGKRSLSELAVSLPADSPLRLALERLAQHSR